MFAGEIARIDGLARRERMIARQDHDERLLCDRFVFEIGFLFPAHERDIELAALEVVGKRRRMIARDLDSDIEQFIAQNACGARQPIDFLADQDAHGENRFDGLRGAPLPRPPRPG